MNKFNYKYLMVCEVTKYHNYYLVIITNIETNDNIKACLTIDGIRAEDESWHIETKYGWSEVNNEKVLYILEDILDHHEYLNKKVNDYMSK